MEDNKRQFEFASQYLVAGVSSSVRLSKALGYPVYTSRGQGSKIYDLQGTEYIDFCMSHGASFLGHDNVYVRKAVEKALEMGVICAHETVYHGQFAQKICELVPCCELVRFTCSGTDATQNAIRLAREFTGKDKIIQFEGCFHGYHESVMFSTHPPLELAGPYEAPNPVPTSGGIPKQISNLVKVLPYNDPEVLVRELRQNRDQIAAIIVEPIGYNSGCMKGTKEFIETLRHETRDRDVLLIFDEIISGFRMCPGGAQEYYGITPDLCTLGKAVAGGTPLSVFGGIREIMQHVKPLGAAQHSGTYNGHLITVLAGIAALDQIASPGFYTLINSLAERLYTGFNEILERHGVKGIVVGLGGMFGIYFGLDKAPANYREIVSQFDSEKLLRFYREAFAQRLYFADYGGGPAHHGFSSMHTMDDIETSLERIDTAVSKI